MSWCRGLAVGRGGPIASSSAGGQRWNSPWLDVAPQAGLLVFFPAQVDHAVTPNHDSDDLRLSLAFDLALTAPLAPSDAAPPPEYLAPHPSQWSAVSHPDERLRDPGQ